MKPPTVRIGTLMLALSCVAGTMPIVGGQEDLDRRVAKLIERIASRDGVAIQTALDELDSLGPQAVPSIIRRIDDRRAVDVGLITVANKHPNAFEARAHYTPKKVVDCLCMILGGGQLYNGGTEAQRAAFVAYWRDEALKKVGGKIERDETRPGRPVVAVTLKGNEITDLSMSYLKAFPELERLTLQGTYLTDSLLEHIRPISSLKELSISGGSITDAGVDGLKAALPRLKMRLTDDT